MQLHRNAAYNLIVVVSQGNIPQGYHIAEWGELAGMPGQPAVTASTSSDGCKRRPPPDFRIKHERCILTAQLNCRE